MLKTINYLILMCISLTIFAQNQNISQSSIFDGEPYIAINPNNSQHIVIAWMGYVVGSKVRIKTKHSLNGGDTWSQESYLPHVMQSYTSADPSLAFDSDGDVYASYIDFTGQTAAIVGGAVYVSKSTDNGSTWNTPVEVIHTNVDPGTKCIDRPWMAIDKSGTASDGNIYVTTMNAKGAINGFNPYVSISTDGGNSFNWRYLDTANFLSGSLIPQPMPTPTVSSDGVFYAVYPSYVPTQSLYAQYLIASSTDNGNSLNYQTVITGSSGMSDTLSKKGYLIKSNPANAQQLYFFYMQETNNNVDVFMTKSINGGTSWSNPLQVNDDSGKAMQDLVWADFDTDGDLVVSWRDRRNGAPSTYITDSEIWGAILWKDSTQFSDNFKISDSKVAYDPILAESGNDFMSVELVNDTLHAVWGDTRNGSLNIWYQRITANGQVVSVKNISSNSELRIELFPNPTTNNVHITGKEITAIKVYNASGQIIYAETLTQPQSSFEYNSSRLKSGVYWFTITTTEGVLTKQVVK